MHLHQKYLIIFFVRKSSFIFRREGGYHEQDVGLVFRVLDHVIQKLKKRSDLKHFEIRLSIFELFCEGKSTLIRDLLNLKHVALSKDDSFLGDVTWKKVSNRKQAAGYISEAFKCRKVSSHNLNQHSSRSFLFMPIKVCQWVTEVDILGIRFYFSTKLATFGENSYFEFSFF